jgi:hypothetical protein
MGVGYRITEQHRVQGRLSSNPPSRMGRRRLRGSSVLLLKAIPGKQHDQILRGRFQKLVRRNKACGMLPCGLKSRKLTVEHRRQDWDLNPRLTGVDGIGL